MRGLDRVKEEPTQAVGFAVRTTAGAGRGRDTPRVYSHCKKPGHLASDCFSLQICTHCKKKGYDVTR